MEPAVIDASVAIKWVAAEDFSTNAMAVRSRYLLTAPELLIAECGNILWKKVRRKEVGSDEAIIASEVIRRAGIEFVAISELIVGAMRFAVEIDHPAYDCFYLELARSRALPLITADERLIRKLQQSKVSSLPALIALSGIGTT